MWKLLRWLPLQLVAGVLGAWLGSVSAQDTPSITLTWVQSTTPGVVSNNVYRGEPGGPYTEVFESSSPTTSYTDSQILTKTQYCYVVTAVVDGVESVFSAQACAEDAVKPPTGIKAKAAQ